MSKQPWFVALIVLMVAGCGQTPAPKGERAPGLLPTPSFRRQWALGVATAQQPVTRLYVRGDELYGYTDTGTCYVMERSTGRMLHVDVIPGAGAGLRPPVRLKGQVVYPTITALYIYDLLGNLTRTLPLQYSSTSGAAGMKDMVFLAEAVPGGGRAVAIDLSLKLDAVRWEYLVPRGRITAAPAVVNDIVYVAAEDATVAALSISSRESVWPLDRSVFQTGDANVADLSADETGVYVASTDSKLYCLNRNNGKIRWLYYAQTALRDSPVVAKDLVFQPVPGLGLVVLDKIEGVDKSKPPAYQRVPRWVASDAVQVLAEDDKFVYLRRSDNHICARNKVTGVQNFVSDRNDFAAYATNTTDGIIYAATKAGRIIAIKPVLEAGMVGELVMGVRPAPDRMGEF